jgi:hypothetical protein
MYARCTLELEQSEEAVALVEAALSDEALHVDGVQFGGLVVNSRSVTLAAARYGGTVSVFRRALCCNFVCVPPFTPQFGFLLPPPWQKRSAPTKKKRVGRQEATTAQPQSRLLAVSTTVTPALLLHPVTSQADSSHTDAVGDVDLGDTGPAVADSALMKDRAVLRTSTRPRRVVGMGPARTALPTSKGATIHPAAAPDGRGAEKVT